MSNERSYKSTLSYDFTACKGTALFCFHAFLQVIQIELPSDVPEWGLKSRMYNIIALVCPQLTYIIEAGYRHLELNRHATKLSPYYRPCHRYVQCKKTIDAPFFRDLSSVDWQIFSDVSRKVGAFKFWVKQSTQRNIPEELKFK
jgi:hypothetical protein